MSTFTIEVTGTYISPFSASNTYNVLHGGYLIDPMASPLSFFYTSTANGGFISTTYTETLTGGEFEISYDDLRENPITLDGYYIFCDTEVVFDLTNFDETESKIIKLIFDPNNGENIQTYSSYVSNNQIHYPILSSVKSIYYPSKNFYTLFNPLFKIHYLDGNVLNLTVPLTSIQCGLFDSYKSKTIVDVLPFYNNTNNILAFINDTLDDNLIISNISTTTEFEFISAENLPFENLAPLALPYGTTSLEQIQITTIQIPVPPVVDNPVLPPQVSQTPTPTPTPTPLYGQGIVTLVDKIQIKEINGQDIYPITNKGMVNFEDHQIISFADQDMYPFETEEGSLIMFNLNNITMFNGDIIQPFP